MSRMIALLYQGMNFLYQVIIFQIVYNFFQNKVNLLQISNQLQNIQKNKTNLIMYLKEQSDLSLYFDVQKYHEDDVGIIMASDLFNSICIQIKDRMGSQSSHPEYNFNQQQWDIVTSNEEYCVWRSRIDPSESIVQHSIFFSSDAEEQGEKEMFRLRLNHPTIVAARYLVSKSSAQFCSTAHQQALFIEKVPIRLSDIEKIPFPDSLHLYSQCLRGYYTLAQRVGCFAVQEQYIGINEKGVVKVWMSQDYFKSYLQGNKVSEEFMVNNIIEIIEKNLDYSNLHNQIPSVRNFLYKNADKLTLDAANQGFSEYVHHYHQGVIPGKLECIDRIGGILAITNRQTFRQNQKSSLSVENRVGNQVINITEGAATSSFNSVQNSARPQLIDSQILKKHYITSPRIQTAPFYYQAPPGERTRTASGCQFVPNLQKHILPPSNIRQNTQIVRKQAVYHNPPAITTLITNPIPVPTVVQNIISPNKSPPVQRQQVMYRVEERPGSKSFGPTSRTILSQSPILPRSLIPNPLPAKPIFSEQPMIGKASIIQMVEPETPQYRQPTPNQFGSNTIDRETISTPPENQQSNGFSFKTHPFSSLPDSFLMQAGSSRSITERTEKILPLGLENNQASPHIQKIGNNPLVEAEERSDSYRPAGVKGSQPYMQEKQVDFQYSPRYQSTNLKNELNTYKSDVQTTTNYTPPTNIKHSQYTAVDIEDGKSSEDFLKKLKELGSFKSPLHTESKPEFPTYQKGLLSQDYGITVQSQSRLDQPNLIKEANSMQNSKHSEQAQSSQDFGRNAVSNIISNSNLNIPSQKNFINTPLKFQKNLDLKYSMFKADEPSPSIPAYEEPTYIYKTYETSYDADLLEDLKNLKT